MGLPFTAGITPTANAAGGYFVLGYGPYAHQSAGASAAVGFDAYRSGDYEGDSALFEGAHEKAEPHVETLYVAWRRRW